MDSPYGRREKKKRAPGHGVRVRTALSTNSCSALTLLALTIATGLKPQGSQARERASRIVSVTQHAQQRAGAVAPLGLTRSLPETFVALVAASGRTAAERQGAFWFARIRAARCGTTRKSCKRCPGSRQRWRPSWACGAPRRAAPLGALLLERCRVAQEEPGGFSISFVEDLSRKYHFECCSQEQCQEWMEALQRASYEYMRRSLIFYRNEIRKMTGKMPGDPDWANPTSPDQHARARKAKNYKVNALVTGATEPCSSGPHLSAPLSPAGNPHSCPSLVHTHCKGTPEATGLTVGYSQ
ncbi:pleckstrin homology domain-containing family J member 1 isoform X1 [Rattus norvegicus]|uniref:pleckstrin homology domain-containing family J member 1 isoform X1 n=1 Tax=Rattus norvegicus TaxID=10116 RepID=UPI002FD86298